MRRRRLPHGPPPLIALLLLLALALCVAPARGAAPTASRTPLQAHASASEAEVTPTPPPTAARLLGVRIDRAAAGPPVPARFLGLSFEAAALGQLSGYAHRGDLVGLLRSLGPGMVRFGGITSDENVAWSEPPAPEPPWATSVIDAAELQGIGALARASDWRVLLTVGAAHFEPLTAAREVAAAHRTLGPYLAAVEIGNEPDAYGKHGFRGVPWLAEGYEEETSAYREAIAVLTPGVPIAGPGVSGSGAFPEWGRAEALAQEPALLTGHHYPLGCAQTPPPSIESLLSALTRRREARSLSIYTAVARDNGIPFRMDETNSVSCGGVAGISNTFASALWATGYIAQAMAAGAAGVNLQGNPLNCTGYTPLCAYGPAAVASGELHAQPDWYALLLTRSLIGDRPLASTVLSGETPAADVLAQAFAAPGGALKIVICDDEPGGAPALRLHLDVGPGMARASLLPLTAPAQDATAGILLGGRAVGADGSWKPPAHLRQLPTRAGILDLRVESDTALLVSVSPRASGRHAPRKR